MLLLTNVDLYTHCDKKKQTYRRQYKRNLFIFDRSLTVQIIYEKKINQLVAYNLWVFTLQHGRAYSSYLNRIRMIYVRVCIPNSRRMGSFVYKEAFHMFSEIYTPPIQSTSLILFNFNLKICFQSQKIIFVKTLVLTFHSHHVISGWKRL